MLIARYRILDNCKFVEFIVGKNEMCLDCPCNQGEVYIGYDCEIITRSRNKKPTPFLLRIYSLI